MELYAYGLIVAFSVVVLVALTIADAHDHDVHVKRIQAILSRVPATNVHPHVIAINMYDLLTLLESHQYDETDGGRVALDGCHLLRTIATPAVN